MKIIKVMRLLALTLAATTAIQTSFAAERIYPSLDENLLRDEIAVATAITEIKIKEAQKIINDTREQALQGKLTPTAAIKIIKEQNAIIDSIESALNNKIKSAVIEVKKADEQGYLGSFVSGVIAPFKSGYGYTPEQKATAQKVIDGLMEQQSQLTKDYEAELKKLPSPKVVRPGSEYDLLTKRYNSIIAQLNEDIHEQQLITGEVMSTERKLFWGAVAAGAAVAGMYLLAPGTEITSEVAKDLENVVVTIPEEPKTQNVEPEIKPAPTVSSQVGVVTDKKPTLAQVIESGLGLDQVEGQTTGQTIVEPELPVVEPELPAVEPELPAVEPELPAVEPELPAVEPELPSVEPELPVVEPELPAVEPELPAVEPELPAVEPEVIKKIDNAKKLLFDIYSQGLDMRVQAEGEENRPKFIQEITDMKNQLSDEINDKLNSGVDPREVLADIESRIVDTRSTLNEIAKQPESNQIGDESGATNDQIAQSLDNQNGTQQSRQESPVVDVGNSSDDEENNTDQSPIDEYLFPSEKESGSLDEEGGRYNPDEQPIIINKADEETKLPAEDKLVGEGSSEGGDVNTTNVDGENQLSTTSDEKQPGAQQGQDTEEAEKKNE